jgi:hypothetical protein
MGAQASLPSVFQANAACGPLFRRPGSFLYPYFIFKLSVYYIQIIRILYAQASWRRRRRRPSWSGPSTPSRSPPSSPSRARSACCSPPRCLPPVRPLSVPCVAAHWYRDLLCTELTPGKCSCSSCHYVVASAAATSADAFRLSTLSVPYVAAHWYVPIQ